MIDGDRVRFIQRDPRGGEQVTEMDRAVFEAIVTSARSLEASLRVLWFGACFRTQTANASRKAAKAGGAA